MLRYRKGAEPTELKPMQNTPTGSYSDLGQKEKDSIRAALARDQGWLCAYCQQRIEPDGESMDIEHWLAQAAHGEQNLNWSHMLGVCKGYFTIEGERIQHCDKSRGCAPLFLHPVEGRGADPRPLLRYDARGRLWSDDERAQSDIRALNLDSDAHVHLLRSNRAAVWQQLRQEIQKRGPSIGTIDQLLRHYQLQPGTKARPYLEFTRYLLLKWRRGFE